MHVIFCNIEAPINYNKKRLITISVLMQQRTFGMRLSTKGLVHLVYMLNKVYISLEINIVKQGERRDGLQC